ncbi:hypothetical protein GUJ93_ZPchr0012g20255 [Zizania palustris]|uniref:Uncharacterized protein n=1 Tax=Zizania palustris TaxID=103762 RepID=A0A8J5WM89_ZIZPA|nr:hypothetical protein GUJ93_ZPchr0012g20255 [Zizania palustris]
MLKSRLDQSQPGHAIVFFEWLPAATHLHMLAVHSLKNQLELEGKPYVEDRLVEKDMILMRYVQRGQLVQFSDHELLPASATA